LPAGTYRLRVVIREPGYPDFFWPYDDTITEFTVVTAAAAPVPAGGPWAAALLALALAATAASARRRRY